MNFSNLPSQLIAILIGWIFTLWLQHRANVRSEAIRKKDKIIDRIDKTVEWVEKNTTFNNESKSHFEEIYSSMISQVEIRINNLNSLLKTKHVSVETVAELRGIDILENGDPEETIKLLRVAAVSLIEELELACDSRYFQNISISARLERYTHEMYGVLVGVSALIALSILVLLIRQFML